MEKVLCIKAITMFLNEEFVEYNKDKLKGREIGNGYITYEKGKEYETHGLNNGQAYVMSDITYPKDHSTYRVFNENRPIRPREVKLWQTFFVDGMAKGSHQDYNLHFTKI